MAKRLSVPSKELNLTIVGPKNLFKASRVQNFSVNSDVPSTPVYEIGNSSKAGDAYDVPGVTLSFSAFDTGIKIFSVLTGTDWTAFPAGGVDISNLGEIDAIVYVKSDTVADYVKTGHARRLQIRDFTFNYSVDGESTEDYSAIGSKRRWLAHDVVVDRFLTGTTSFTLTQTPIQLKNSNYALSVILDGKYLTEVSAAPATGEYRIVGTTLTTFDSMTTQALVIYHANPAGTAWTDVNDPDMPAAIRGKDVTVKIGANSILRVQSVSINGTLNSQPVNEMGNKDKTAGYQRQVPEVDGTITVLDTDTELLSLLTYGVTSSGVEWNPGEGCPPSGISLSIELTGPCDNEAPYTVLKTVYLDSIAIIGDSYTATVNQNTTQTFNFRSTTAHCVIYSGSR